VDKEDAVIGFGNNMETDIDLNADHSGICKFSSPENPAYITVRDELEEMAEGILKTAGPST
jgi:hypothetical protein